MPFNKKSDSKISNDVTMKYHMEWCNKYPELKTLKLESGYDDGSYSWLYSLNKKHEDISIDLFLEVVDKDGNWSLNLELVLECEDEYLVNNKENKSHTQDEKHYEKRDLDWEKLNLHMKKTCEWMRGWNEDFYKEWGFYPLID
jgi:hypothetical protein